MENNNPNLEPQVPQNEAPQQPTTPVYVAPAAPAKDRNAMLGLIFGIIGLACPLVLGSIPIVGLFSSLIALVLSILGIIFSVKARKANPTGMATAGLVFSIIGTCLSGIFTVCAACTACAICAASNALSNELNDLVNSFSLY